MAIEDALYTRLSGHAGLSALVGDRIYPVKLPQSPVYPAIIYESRGGDRLHNMGVDAGIRRPIFQIACFAATYDAATNVGEQVIAALSRFRGTVGGIVIQEILMIDEPDDFWSDEPPVWQRVLEFEVSYEG